ncbi:hypothetical protein GLU60_04015 [Nanohaloarchaea archaeon H01]|nr:hypothetical protein [Nanohaloarchaea archaeon H01]
MQEAAKGQSGLVVAAVALTLAIPLSQIPNFAVEYVAASSFDSMERNSMRYQSAAFGYKFASEGINNQLDYTEAKNSIRERGDKECSLRPEFRPEKSNVSFSRVDAGQTFTNELCLNDEVPVLDKATLIYPSVPFYETQEDDRNIVTSTVVP